MIFNISKMVYQKYAQLLHNSQNIAVKSFRNFPEKSSKLKFFQKCLKFSKNSLKFPKILQKFRLFFFIARAPFGEYPLISCRVDDSDEKSLICFAQQPVLLTLLCHVRGLSPLLVGRNTTKKSFCQSFCREILQKKCRVNVKIAVKFSSLSILT